MAHKRKCPTCEGSGYIILAPAETKKRDRHDFFEHFEDKKDKVRTTRQFKPGDDIERRVHLPSENPDHLCGLLCDGQDGVKTSDCARVRIRLFGKMILSDRERLLFSSDAQTSDGRRSDLDFVD